MSTHANEISHLKELGKSNYEIAEGESDIRGWTVKNEQGTILGEVYDLLLNTKIKRVDFLVLDLVRNELNLKERKVILPVEYAEINEAHKNVIFPGLTANELTALPSYEKGKINSNAIDQTKHVFAGITRRDPHSIHTEHSKLSATQYNETQAQSPMSEDQQHRKMPEVSSNLQYTVIGVFEHTSQAQAAVEYLLNSGFIKKDITISNRTGANQDGRIEHDKKSIPGFFRFIFGDEDEARSYSEAAMVGAVVTVDAFSIIQAEEAAGILDQHGTVNMSERMKQGHRLSVDRPKHNCRIIERKVAPR